MAKERITNGGGHRPRLAFVSPLPPEHTGVADYSARLLPELDRFYDIEVVTPQRRVDDPGTASDRPMRTPAWFRANAGRYDRVLYQLGNSPFHAHMFDLLEHVPGVVTLHDFFLGDVLAYRERRQRIRCAWRSELYRSHGYPALVEARTRAVADVAARYPCNWSVLQHSLGVVVHSEYARRLAEQWYGDAAAARLAMVPMPRRVDALPDRETARRELGLSPDAFLVCSFGVLGPAKLNDRLLSAWTTSPLHADRRCELVFVGENKARGYGPALSRAIRRLGGRIRITGWVSAAEYNQYLAAADLAVQLRGASRGEVPASLLDAMAAGVPIIANAHGAVPEIAGNTVRLLPDTFDDAHLVRALEEVWNDPGARAALAARAKARLATRHDPARCAADCADAIESFYGSSAPAPIPPQRQLFVDVSALAAGSLARAEKHAAQAILRDLLAHWSGRVRVEPVIAASDPPGCAYARKFTSRFLRCGAGAPPDAPIQSQAEDILVGIGTPTLPEYTAQLMEHGVSAYVLTHDEPTAPCRELLPPGVDIIDTETLLGLLH